MPRPVCCGDRLSNLDLPPDQRPDELGLETLSEQHLGRLAASSPEHNPYRGPIQATRRLAPEFLARVEATDRRHEQDRDGESQAPADLRTDGTVDPALAATRSPERDARIVRMRDEGRCAAEIAAEHGISKRTVERVLRRAWQSARSEVASEAS